MGLMTERGLHGSTSILSKYGSKDLLSARANVRETSKEHIKRTLNPQ